MMLRLTGERSEEGSVGLTGHAWKCIWCWSKQDLEHRLCGCSALFLCLNAPAVHTFNRPNNCFVHRVCWCVRTSSLQTFTFLMWVRRKVFFFYFVGFCLADRLVGCIRSTLEPSSLITFFLYNNKTNQPAALKDGVLRCSGVTGSWCVYNTISTLPLFSTAQ